MGAYFPQADFTGLIQLGFALRGGLA